ncbi:DUF6677 family protein [Mucisphaera sp.]|uniref:DUF6677 family protein n=1 Tax=Mucisphaera sp. TaxID=2913024 RepID=UPI003D0B19B1
MSQTNSADQPRWHPLAALAGWLIPGAGHAVLGETKRALVLFFAIGGLWLSGLLIGGISVLDRQQHPAWYACQVLVAPTIPVEWLHASMKTPQGKPPPPEGTLVNGQPAGPPAFVPSYNHTHEQGTIFAAMAGLLNLLALIDVAYRDPRAREKALEVMEGEAAHA